MQRTIKEYFLVKLRMSDNVDQDQESIQSSEYDQEIPQS